MSFKRKMAVTTLAASMVAASFGGFPLSNKGLIEKIGLSNTSYASGLDAPSLKTKLQAIHTSLNFISGGTAAVDALQAAITGVSDVSLIYPITDKLGYDRSANAADIAIIFNLFKAAATAIYDPNLAALETLRMDSSVQALLASDTSNSLSVTSIEAFILATETQALSTLNGMDWSARLNLAAASDSSNAARKSFMNTVLTNVMLDHSAGVGKYLSDHSITSTDVTNVLFALQDAIDVQAGTTVSRNAFVKLALAYYSYKALSTSAPASTVIITPPAAPAAIDQTKKQLVDLVKTLETATPAEKAKLLGEALKNAQNAIQTTGTVDASKTLKVEGTKSTAQLNTDDIKKQMTSLQTSAKELNAQLKDLGVNAPELKLTLTIDLGQTTTTTGEVTVSKDIILEAEKLGFSELSVVMNGVTVTSSVSEFSEDVTLTVGKADKSTATKVTNKPLASEVYDFEFSVKEQHVTAFTKPVTLKLPIVDVSNVDTDLLALAKIINGKLEYYGGKYNTSGKYFQGQRSSFSSYVVVENKVEFTDTDKVKAWAGRQIQVMAAKGAIAGKSEGVFAPQDQVTRAEFAKMLISAMSLEDANATSVFKDVKSTDWFASYVAAAMKHGIIYGRTADQFAPNAKITRAEMATMITRTLKATQELDDVANPDAAVASFSDASKIHPSLKAGVAFAASHNLVFGDAGKFRPNDNATRAEAAVMLYRTFNFAE
ncbi:S-layer homology domain-containing protein [Cohnella sp.]|uniref:S-layer homology domain-containing protein n=1 Tax=Cohnella sp. TaxID=1883426 RepID=UPI0035698E11